MLSDDQNQICFIHKTFQKKKTSNSYHGFGSRNMADFLLLGYLIMSLEIIFINLVSLFQNNADFIAQETPT